MLRTPHSLILLTVLTIAPVFCEAADSWPTFRGPDGDGIVRDEVDVPLRWSKTQNVSFRVPIPGQGWSSPVVSEGLIYVSAAIPVNGSSNAKKTDYELSLLILDAESGDIQKTIPLLDQKAADSPKIHKKNSHASPTPLIDGNRVFVHFGYQGTVATDRTGKVLWKNRELFFKPVHGNGGTPVLYKNRLIFTCDGADDPKIVALDADSGKVAWETSRPVDAPKKFSFCTPTLIEVAGRPQLIAPGSNCVLALDPLTGDEIWRLLYTGYSVIPKPVYHQGLIFLSTSYDSPSLLAIDPTGSGDVTDSHLKWSIDKNAPHTPSMIASDGLLYSISDGGIAMCVEAKTGKVIYKKRVGGSFSASPIKVGNRIYYTNEAGLTTVVAAGRKYEVLAKNDLDERTLASMAVDSDALIVRTADAIYRIEQ